MAPSNTTTSARQIQRPANVIYQFIVEGRRVRVWLVHDAQVQIEGVLVGYDQFMNVVLDDASEVDLKTNKVTKVGKMLLRSDNVGVVHPIGA